MASGAAAADASNGVSIDSVLKTNGVGAWSKEDFFMWALAHGTSGALMGADGRPMAVAWTLQIGFAANLQLPSPFGVNVNFGWGVAIDGHWNLETYGDIGAGVGYSTGRASVGVQALSSQNADAVYELRGPFATTSSGLGLGAYGSVDTFYGWGADGRPITGGGGTVGFGVGGGAASGGSVTCVANGCF
jgi:hypothetical protein